MPVTQPRRELKPATEPQKLKHSKKHVKIRNDVRVLPPVVTSPSDSCPETEPPKVTKYKARRRLTSQKYSHHDAYAEYFTNFSTPVSVPALRNTYLRPGAKFVGEQQSATARYDLKVEFKTVDLVSSVVTGFFQISGLTVEHPMITTCFKGEIINNPLHKLEWGNNTHTQKYSFITEERSWGSFPRNDMDHWKKLTGSPNEISEPDLQEKLHRIHAGQQDNQYVYMRWKEEFLLPDSRIKLLKDASFAGFYYIVLNIGGGPETTSDFTSNIIPGTISGLYFHTQSEPFQSLSLRYVEDRGVSHVFDFV